jgi:hypothetical protein
MTSLKRPCVRARVTVCAGRDTSYHIPLSTVTERGCQARRRLTTILPAMSLAEALDAIRLHRVGGRTGAHAAQVPSPLLPSRSRF